MNPAQAAVAELLDGIDPGDQELIDLARQILEPVEPLVYEVRPTDEGEGAWWLAEPPAGWTMPDWAHEQREAPDWFPGSEWEYLATLDRERQQARELADRAIDLPPDWWAGVLEGLRIGYALAQEIAAQPAHDRSRPEGAPVRPIVPGRRAR
jgi:hypothetical protein